MDPKFRPALARRMTLEVMEARYVPRWSRDAIEGLAIMLDDLAVPDDDDDFFGDNPRDPFVEFRTIERDMKAALEALDALGFELLKLEPAQGGLKAIG